jgi:drug/metabolite transporter (DMT)-like permease
VGAGYPLVVLIWGTTWFGVHAQVNGTAPHVAAGLRLGVASLIFFAIAAWMRMPLRPRREQIVPIVIQAMCFFGFNYVAVYTASQYLTSGVLAVVFSICVPFNLIADWAIHGTRPRAATVAAAIAGVAGIALVFEAELERAVLTRDALWGATLGVFAAAIVAIGNVLASRLAATDLGAVRLNAFGMAAGTAAILLWGAASGAPWTLEITSAWLGSFAYLVVVGSVVAFGVYMKILPAVGVVAGAYVVVLAPVVAIGISAVFEGFPLRPTTLLGVPLLLIGHSILIVQRRRTSAAERAR